MPTEHQQFLSDEEADKLEGVTFRREGEHTLTTRAFNALVRRLVRDPSTPKYPQQIIGIKADWLARQDPGEVIKARNIGEKTIEGIRNTLQEQLDQISESI